MSLIDATKHYINGAWVAPSAPNAFDVINPSTEQAFAQITLGSVQDTDAAVAAAKAAFSTWGQSTKAERLDALQALLSRYVARLDDIGDAISQEMGAPKDFARDVQATCGDFHLEYFIKALENMELEWPLRAGEEDQHMVREAIGVAALITPWNWPMNQISLKVGAAIAAGCTMVLKPSEIAPMSGVLFAELVHEAGLPAGVFNMVNGDGITVGSRLSEHPDVDMVSFTGSTRAGRLVTKAAADTVKRVSLELGGKGPNIIFADVPDVAKAVRAGVGSVMSNSGQSCNAPTRMLVERSIYEQAKQVAADVCAATQVGPSADAGKHIGPVVSQLQYEKIQGLIQTGLDEGAQVLGGGTGKPKGINAGYYVQPTVFGDVTPDMTIFREEIFGPVMSLTPFDSEAEAIALANDTEYGLASYVQTGDSDRARRVTRQLRAGMVIINGAGRAGGSPFGGYKQSGNGREGGTMGIEDFQEVKAVAGW